MANRTAWVAGLGQGLSWGTLINSSDITTLANGSVGLSSVSDITNGTSLDIYMDISHALSITSGTPPAGANISYFLYALNQDGTHYGDGLLTSGSTSTTSPSIAPCAVCGIPPTASTTAVYGFAQGIIIPPGSFRVALQNNGGAALTGTQTVKYRTYNLNLNS